MNRINSRPLENILKTLRLKIERRSSRSSEESLEVSMKILNSRLMKTIKRGKKEWRK
jgi:hypothetical protein